MFGLVLGLLEPPPSFPFATVPFPTLHSFLLVNKDSKAQHAKFHQPFGLAPLKRSKKEPEQGSGEDEFCSTFRNT